MNGNKNLIADKTLCKVLKCSFCDNAMMKILINFYSLTFNFFIIFDYSKGTTFQKIFGRNKLVVCVLHCCLFDGCF